jgi:hypothetical protein
VVSLAAALDASGSAELRAASCAFVRSPATSGGFVHPPAKR